jgi:hypothetical protein
LLHKPPFILNSALDVPITVVETRVNSMLVLVLAPVVVAAAAVVVVAVPAPGLP